MPVCKQMNMTMREARQRAMQYGFRIRYWDGQYQFYSDTCKYETDDLEDGVFFAMRFKDGKRSSDRTSIILHCVI